ncbi:MAG: zf-HC2 domain-containing protein [Oscillospiraceae bacterium]|nr:zf-HC2 domain-containing protein [Oscillospiraceae bacterium]
MKFDCAVIRDLLPLYTDNACSEKSREAVDEHLRECPDCQDYLHRLQSSEIETNLHNEKNEVIEYGIRQFKRRSAAVGSAISGSFMIPILVCLYLNFVFGATPGWFFIVLASLCVAASLTIVPIIVHEDKLFWMFCSFCASLVVLLGVICLYTHGSWFWIAASSSLFGLAAVFLPFFVRAKPIKKLLGNHKPLPYILGLDIALFMSMMNAIFTHGRQTALFARGILIVIVLVLFELFLKKRSQQ